MNPNVKPSETTAVVAAIDPDAYAAGTYTTGWLDAARFHQFLAIVMAGDLGTSATLDAKFEQATSSGGAGAKDVTGAAITQLTEAGTDSNKQALINLRHENLDVNNSFRYVRLSLTVATATSDAGALVLGVNPRYGLPTDYDAASVDEIAN